MRTKPTALQAVGLILFLLVQSSETSVTLSNSVEPQFLAIAKAALVTQNEVLVTGIVQPHPAPSYGAAIKEHLIETLQRRALLARHNIVYTRVRTELAGRSLEIRAPEAHLIATEHTILDLIVHGGDRQAPETTEYYQDYLFNFTFQKNRWILATYWPLNTTAAAQPSTDLPSLDTSIAPSKPMMPAGYTPDSAPDTHASLNRSAIVNYAYTYWRKYNLSYRNFNISGTGGGDCTNFVSQALHAGGWQDVGGWHRDTSAWWSNTLGQSWSWINAHYWLIFTDKQARGSTADYISDLVPGDVLQVDLNQDEIVDHSMIVTDKDSGGTIYLTYHNNDSRDRPFWDIYYLYPDAQWYGVRLH
jgi:hypothetical protein